MIPENLSGIHGEEERIRICSLEFIEKELTLNDSIERIFDSLDTIYSILKVHVTQDLDELAIQYLGIRLFNSISSMQKLLFSGYYQSAFMIMRDIIETGSLLDYFTLDDTRIKLWRECSESERKNLFKQVTIREALDNRDGYKTKKRYQIYSMYSEYASHPTFVGSKLISKDGLGQIGPFYEPKYLVAGIQDLSRFSVYFTIIFISFFKSHTDEVLLVKSNYIAKVKEWEEEI
ncbi:hypothetical protein PN4B1_49000 [Paenibacillus naphthalenovorans]|uniref:hypothetical protein n=1 Tax=Paenibacillus naphthalenovorans TaxID=162209 RepID=UPI0010B9B183|nr:hypothetical protein [Paenibacillus naphthalenovorans]GCL74914.1 hypothetical protein PN4B1_49000 [Paenibacillus naphthalenovorans]